MITVVVIPVTRLFQQYFLKILGDISRSTIKVKKNIYKLYMCIMCISYIFI